MSVNLDDGLMSLLAIKPRTGLALLMTSLACGPNMADVGGSDPIVGNAGVRVINATSSPVDVLIDGKPSTLLVMPKGGAVRLQFEGKTVQIVTPASSLGESLLGMRVGDTFEFEVGPQVRECEVTGVQ